MFTFDEIFVSEEKTLYLKAIYSSINFLLSSNIKKIFLDDFNAIVNDRFAAYKGKSVEIVSVTPEHTKTVLLHHISERKEKGLKVHVEFFSTVAGDALVFIP